MSEKRNRVKCPRCGTEFKTQWEAGDFETCPQPMCRLDFLIGDKDITKEEEDEPEK